MVSCLAEGLLSGDRDQHWSITSYLQRNGEAPLINHTSNITSDHSQCLGAVGWAWQSMSHPQILYHCVPRGVFRYIGIRGVPICYHLPQHYAIGPAVMIIMMS